MTITKIMQDAITALLKLNNNQDRILVLYEAMRHEEERFQECASCGGRAQPVAAFRSYKCMSCGGVFQSDWSDEDANAEFKAKHGTDPDPAAGYVCDVCWRRNRRFSEAVDRTIAHLGHVNPSDSQSPAGTNVVRLGKSFPCTPRDDDECPFF